MREDERYRFNSQNIYHLILACHWHQSLADFNLPENKDFLETGEKREFHCFFTMVASFFNIYKVGKLPDDVHARTGSWKRKNFSISSRGLKWDAAITDTADCHSENRRPSKGQPVSISVRAPEQLFCPLTYDHNLLPYISCHRLIASNPPWITQRSYKDCVTKTELTLL